MAIKTETRRTSPESSRKLEVRVEGLKIAETLGKFSKMRAKNGAGDKSRIYGH